MSSHQKLYTQMDEGATPHRLLHLYKGKIVGHRHMGAGQVKAVCSSKATLDSTEPLR